MVNIHNTEYRPLAAAGGGAAGALTCWASFSDSQQFCAAINMVRWLRALLRRDTSA
jgi:hypothetical protein